MFIDKAKIYVKAGNGGNGCVSFYTEKYVANGGPDGGNGGKGGDVYFEADDRKRSLLDFQYSSHFKAEDGQKGERRLCAGKNGKDLTIKVPPGTIIRDGETGGIIADMFNSGERVLVLEGGEGGKGNACFKSSKRQAPRFAQTGVRTEEKRITLELKTIADVGLVGYPNVGKSTLLSVISAAKPKIADYPFTTLSPNLGVVKVYDDSFVAADIPGLIDGASEGMGLGTDFLRHIDRVRLIVHVVDITGEDPVRAYRNINAELKKYDEELSKLKQIIALNKCDLLSGGDEVKNFKKHIKSPAVLISGITREGVDELIQLVYKTLQALPPVKRTEYEPFVYEKRDTTSYVITRADDGAYEVSGGMMNELARNVILDNYDSFRYFQKRLRDEGVIKALVKAGIKDGDVVRILDIEFDFVE